MRLGVDYYPEHWPEERWPVDARLMREAGISVVRLAEFAWAQLEPEPGRYDFAWLDRAIGIIAAEGMKVVLGTPTAAPPAWLVAMHPEILPVDEHDHPLRFGSRLHRCLNNPVMRERSRAITKAMAGHYGRRPEVAAWQTDNEFSGNRCYCPCCQRGFQAWLEKRYGSLDALNKAWGTAFWSQIYTAWDQIVILPPACGEAGYNPSLRLDYLRFASDSAVEFQREQVEILRSLTSGQPITHNLMGLHDSLDYYALGRDLDFVSWDNYPWRSGASTALAHDIMRGIKEKNYWVMEERVGPCGWTVMNGTTKPGEIRLWTYQAFAHGADLVSYFRWRSCLSGTEQYWHGVLNHDAIPRRRYREVASIGQELLKISPALDGSTVVNETALLYDYEQIWAFQIQPNVADEKTFHPRPDDGIKFQEILALYHEALTALGAGVDVVGPDSDLSRYKLVIMPPWYLVRPSLAKKLENYVEQGGRLVMSFRSGVKGESNLCLAEPLPGPFRRLLGLELEEYDGIGEKGANAAQYEGESYPLRLWCDVINLQGAEALASYGRDFYAGTPVVTRNAFGRGKAYYLASLFDQAFYRRFFARLLDEAGVETFPDLPDKVEAAVRVKGEKRFYFLCNFNPEPKRVELPAAGWRSILTDERAGGEITLPGFGVEILEA